MTQKVQVVSQRYPCGVTLLANILLELGVYTYIQSRGHWWSRSSGKPLLGCDQISHSSAYMPFFNRNFDENAPIAFTDLAEFSWGHQPPASQFASHPSILLLRHYRGSLFSQFKRDAQVTPELDLIGFVRSPGNYFGWSNLDEWSAYNFLWLALAPRLAVVSFEGLKKNPVEAIQKVLAVAGLSRDASDIERATQASSVSNTKLSFQTTQKRLPQLKEADYIRKGDPDEHRSTWDIEGLLDESLAREVQGYLDREGTAEVRSLLSDISWGDLIHGLENRTQSSLSEKRRGLAFLNQKLYFDAESVYKKTMKTEADQFLMYCFHLTWQLRGSALFYSYARMLDFSDESTEIALKAFAYLLGRLSDIKIAIKAARGPDWINGAKEYKDV